MSDKITVFDKQAEGKYWLKTATGIEIDDINNPSPALIEIEDIATGLANYPRWGGQLRRPCITVAQHACITAHLAPHPLRPMALMHDATEAYLGDATRPVKNIIAPLYKPLEAKWQAVIFERYGLDPAQLHEVKIYDLEALSLEYEYYHNGKNKLWEIGRAMFANFEGIWSPEIAYHNFMKMFCAYFPNR